jgi:hypothetical protein
MLFTDFSSLFYELLGFSPIYKKNQINCKAVVLSSFSKTWMWRAAKPD